MKRFLKSAVPMLLGVVGFTNIAWAQTPARLTNEEQGVLVWVIAAGLIIVVGLPAFIKPKRSHLN